MSFRWPLVLLILITGLPSVAEAKAKAKSKAPPSTVELASCDVAGGRNVAKLRMSEIKHVGGAGQLDKNILRRYVRQKYAQLSYCYEKQLLVKPELAGTVTITWTVLASGQVANVLATGLGDEQVEACHKAVFESILFPKPSGNVPLTATADLELGAHKVDAAYHAKKLPAALRTQLGGVRACWDRVATADPGASAAVSVTFDFAADGTVAPRGLDDEEGDETLDTCVARAFAAMKKLPPTEATTTCALVMTPKATNAWSLDAARKAGAAVVAIDADSATLDGADLPLVAPEGVEPPPKTIYDALTEKAGGDQLALLIIEPDSAASANEVLGLLPYALDVRIARKQGKVWTGLPLRFTMTHDAGDAPPWIEIGAAEVRLTVGEGAAAVLGKPSDAKAITKALKAARGSSFALQLSVEDGVPWATVLGVLVAARAAGFVEVVLTGFGFGGGTGTGFGTPR